MRGEIGPDPCRTDVSSEVRNTAIDGRSHLPLIADLCLCAHYRHDGEHQQHDFLLHFFFA